VDLRELAAQCLEVRARTDGEAEHSVALSGEAVYVHGDPTRLAQVLDNLVDNALKYTPRGGRVEIVTERIGDQSVLRVRDSGIGMPTELVPRIFDLFTQAPQTLERSHGASASAWRSSSGWSSCTAARWRPRAPVSEEGSEFTITLPAGRKPTRRPAGASVGARDRARPAGRRVLVVEDSADARLGVQLLLEQAGHVRRDRLRRSGGLAKLGHSIRTSR